jgi:hypothetical protein
MVDIKVATHLLEHRQDAWLMRICEVHQGAESIALRLWENTDPFAAIDSDPELHTSECASIGVHLRHYDLL